MALPGVDRRGIAFWEAAEGVCKRTMGIKVDGSAGQTGRQTDSDAGRTG
jgi:hypothetical protein